ncbi:hypothetical protein GCM10007856_02130 [Azospirillum oryzae]|nr:hypothetical protein GCM10007856_02130 [Azospirillum oryzae]
MMDGTKSRSNFARGSKLRARPSVPEGNAVPSDVEVHMRVLQNIVFGVIVAAMAGVTVHQGLYAIIKTAEQEQMTMTARLSDNR